MKVIKAFSTTETQSPALSAMRRLPSRIALHVAEGIVLLPWNEIQYCSAESNYTHVYATEGRHYMLSKTLREVESKLPGGHFARIHQSHLVNLEAVREVTSTHVKIIDKVSLPLARAKRKQFYDLMDRISIHI